MPGLGSLQCLATNEESSSAKPLKPLNLGSVPDLGIGRLGSLGTPPGSEIPNRLGEYFDTVEFIYDKKRNDFKNIRNLKPNFLRSNVFSTSFFSI